MTIKRLLESGEVTYFHNETNPYPTSRFQARMGAGPGPTEDDGMGKNGPFQLDELTKDEFEERVRDDPLVILPVGCTEEHGGHLPLCTDSIQAEELAKRLASRFDALLAPSVRYGECSLLRQFPGTISLGYGTLKALIIDILDGLCGHGIRKVLVLSGHAGRTHMTALREGGREVIGRYDDLKLMILSDYEIIYDKMGEEMGPDDGHAGTIETARVLAIRKELVKGQPTASKNRIPRYSIVPDPRAHFERGYRGDPSKATAELGKRTEDLAFDEIARLIEDELLGQGPSRSD